MKGGINKNKWIHLRLSEAEHRAILIKVKKTTSRNVSQYLRDVLFDRPVTATYRNLSQDDILIQMTVLNRELAAIGNNLNQVTKKLHTLQLLEERHWRTQFNDQAEAVLIKIMEVKTILHYISGRWLQ